MVSHRPRRWLLPVILAALALAAGSVIAARYALARRDGIATVFQNGEPVRTIDLYHITEPIEFDITDDSGHTNTIRAERGRICMAAANCPDRLCVKQGWITNGLTPVVCLPHAVVITISGRPEVDGAAR